MTWFLWRAFGAVACVYLVGAASAYGQSTSIWTTNLDALIQANATEQVLRRLREAPDGDELLRWLHARAEDGYVPAQSELGWRLAKSNKREALAWYVLSLINLTLDQNECSSQPGASRTVRQLMRGFPDKISEQDPLLYADALEDALKIARRHETGKAGKQSAWWICAPDEIDPPAVRLTPDHTRLLRRQLTWENREARERDVIVEIRLNANLNPEGYRLWKLDQKYWAGKSISDLWNYLSVAWLDNDTLLFGGYQIPQKVTLPRKYEPIYRWDLATGVVAQYAGEGFGLCHFRGVISYYVRRDEKLFYREGSLGKEQETEIDPKEAEDIWPGRSGLTARFQCRRINDAHSSYGGRVRALESGGRLKFNGPFHEKNRTAEYYPPGIAQPVVFDPFEGLKKRPGNDYDLGLISYSEYLDASWLTIATRGALVATTPIWILYKDGRIERNQIPPGPWTDISTTKAKGGWALPSVNGLYFLGESDKTPTKVLKGRIDALRLSSNGCRAAVAVRMPKGEGEPLWVVDFCQKGIRR
jgi:hypothetical protein